MASLLELKSLLELDVSETITKERFILYLNAALRDLSEVYKYEKSISDSSISQNDQEIDLPDDLFQIIAVTVTNTGKNIENELVHEISVYDYDYYNDNSIVKFRNAHVYSRFKNKIKVKSEIYSNDNYSGNSTLNIKYYGSLPEYDYTNADNLDFTLEPPILEKHYHEALTFYMAYRYWLNNDDEAKADRLLVAWEKQKAKIDMYVHGHRHASNISRRKLMTRR